MAPAWNPADLLDRLQVGVSAVTWHPESPERTEWVYVNETRCRLVGKTREEVLAEPPFARISRETRAQVLRINERIAEFGKLSVESTLVHRSHEVIPVMLHLERIDRPDGDLLFAEFHDLRSFKKTESLLERAQDRAHSILNLVTEEKRQIGENVRTNMGLVALPLIDQLRTQADPAQKDLLDVLEKRVRYVTRNFGVVAGAGPDGARLTRRQIVICEMIREGLTTKEIAAALGCSPSTVNNHRNTIRRRLGLSGRAENLQAYLNSLPARDDGDPLESVRT